MFKKSSKESEDNIWPYEGSDLQTKKGENDSYSPEQRPSDFLNNSLPFERAKRGLDPPRLPKWKLDKAIYEEIQVSRLKFSDYLPHQWGNDGEVFYTNKYLVHCEVKHRGFSPAGSLINASPYGYWLIWYDDLNYLEFMQAKGDPKYVKADPPWI